MRIIVALLVAALFRSSAYAQDSQGRERRPPGAAGSSSSGSGGGSGSGSDGATPRSSGGDSSSGSSSGSSSSGSDSGGSGGGGGGGYGGGGDVPWIPRRPEHPETATRTSGEERARPRPAAPPESRPAEGPAVRRLPPEARPNGYDGQTLSAREPDSHPRTGPKGEPLGDARRREEPPSYARSRVIGGAKPRPEENVPGRDYWHEEGGTRYCHHVDAWGGHWYTWYFDDGYYDVRWDGGRWWRHDHALDAWCWLYEGRWYRGGSWGYFVSIDGRWERYADAEGGVVLQPSSAGRTGLEGARFYSDDGSRLVKLDEERNAFLYDLSDSPRFAPRFLGGEVVGVAFEYDGATLTGVSLRQEFKDAAIKRSFSADGEERGASKLETYASAAPSHALRVSLGRFSSENRSDGDVLKGDAEFLDFDQRKLDRPSVDVEYLKGAGHYVEFGVSVSKQASALDSRYRDWTHKDGADIKQQLSVSNVPVQATMRLYPAGRDRAVQPYVGLGVGVNKWKYQEKGEFADFNSPGYPFYTETYRAQGTAVGPVLLAGLRVPVGGRVFLEGEWRRQWASGQLDPKDGWAGDHVDLGGSRLQAGVTVDLSRRR